MTPPLNCPANPAELKKLLASLMTPQWESAWLARLRDARHANMASVKRSIGMMIDQAEARHAAGDAEGFRSWAQFTLAHAAGERWAEPMEKPEMEIAA